MMTLGAGMLRKDPVLQFMIALAFYGMSTFEGPLMSIRYIECVIALYRLTIDCATFRCTWLGWLHYIWLLVLSGTKAVGS